MKIVQAPSQPVRPLQRFVVAGVATPDDAGKPLVVSLNNDFKITGPIVAKDGTWRLDLVFPKPGNHHLSVNLGDRRADWSFQVIGENGETAPPGPIVPEASPVSGRRPLPRAKASEGAPTLRQLVEEAFRNNHSDVHLAVGREPRFRSRGQMQPTTYPTTDDNTFMAWMQEVLSDLEIQHFQENLDFDGAAQYPFARVRINLFETLNGPAMVLRLIPMEIKTFEQLCLPAAFANVCHAHKGLILVTGPTGSGKSTTLAAMIDYINRNMTRHIITIEDPIEFVHQSRRSVINQREVGIHSLRFDNALRASLREDPDVILIGEMRDRETVETALKAAQTGHLVFGTLHTNGAVKTIERILALYSPEDREAVRTQIAEAMVACISQALVPTTDGKRAPVFEVLINTDAIRDYIKKGQIDEVEDIIPRSEYEGMCTMNQILYKLYLEGRINEEIALANSPRENEMAIMLRGGSLYSSAV
ncbi:type IV pilus twitching motility protein PilT [Limnothrix sp. FACHB-708]|uniref:type IV pilus twitching motility protein PilT n=1 Tax=unclassified Limnothrix TaxID=2632864 RepID=UPI001683539B|nr:MULTISPECIES: type IV pilus twitching motility protein PilT [unclassified Limnothrix]MBD2554727.1 type IV pilus twitching motility protein PilT [Limnothrix sp. FACHB-708]MBD2591934.1 type IV pilus twitching motility protein PilT [Limnothrix sp. FACHB-406]